MEPLTKMTKIFFCLIITLKDQTQTISSYDHFDGEFVTSQRVCDGCYWGHLLTHFFIFHREATFRKKNDNER